jgi:hypothetical protein
MTGARWSVLLAGLFVVSASATVATQKVFTAAELQVVERTVGTYFEAAKSQIAAQEYETAKVRLIVAREYLARSWTFWTRHARGDAAKMVRRRPRRWIRSTIRLSEAPIDAARVQAAVQEASAACEACHADFRVEHPATGTYDIKPGIISEPAGEWGR